MEKLIYKPFMLNHKIMAEDGKILGLPKNVVSRVVIVCAGIIGVCVCLHFCKRTIDVNVDANRNRVMIQYVTPKK